MLLILLFRGEGFVRGGKSRGGAGVGQSLGGVFWCQFVAWVSVLGCKVQII